MAVYKPSNCRPFLNSVDLTHDINVQCEVNTSNERITGYKIRLLNNINEEIFVGSKYSKVNYPQGINGTVLSVPLIITGGLHWTGESWQVENWENVGYNSLFYISYINGGDHGSIEVGQYYCRIGDGAFSITGSPTAKLVTGISNGNLNQPYKWQITLAQGQEGVNGTFEENPSNDWKYDILVCAGQILGSNGERIQSNLSDEIYKDYYIQLLDGESGDVNNRVRISSYDRTFGYIYPQEGFLTDDDVEKATKFKIYKDTNNPSEVSAARVVNYGITSPIKDGTWYKAFGYENPPTDYKVEQLANRGNKYYYDLPIYGIGRGQYASFNSEGFTILDIFGNRSTALNVSPIIFSSTRFLLMDEGGGLLGPGFDDAYGSANPLNGVWVIVGAADWTVEDKDKDKDRALKAAVTQAENDLSRAIGEGDTEREKAAEEALEKAQEEYNNMTGHCYIRFQRPTDANTYANYIGRNWFVRDGIVGNYIGGMWGDDDITEQEWPLYFGPQINVSSNAVAQTDAGAINQAPLQFFAERPVVIYPNNKDGHPEDAKGVTDGGFTDDTGVIFKNGKQKDGSWRVYLNPFNGLENEMRLRWVNSRGASEHVDITELNTDYWYFTPKVDSSKEGQILTDSNILFDPGTQYKVYSYFKTSDENPFYGYSTPKLSLSFRKYTAGENGDDGKYEYVSAEKYFEGLDKPPYVNKLNSRSLTVMGEYEQDQYISWKSFRWVLIDLSVNDSRETEWAYSGEMKYDFDGLQDAHKYRLILQVEDEVGYIQEEVVEFQVALRGMEDVEAFPLWVTFDCATQSVDINFVMNGLVEPDYWNISSFPPVEEEAQGVEYPEEGGMRIPESTEVTYSEAKVSIFNREDSYVPLSGPFGQDITFNTSHGDLNSRFAGEIFEAEIVLDEESNDKRVKIGCLLPPTTQLDENGDRIPNEHRNQIILNYWVENKKPGTEEWYCDFQSVEPSEIQLYVNGELKEGKKWRESNRIVSAYQHIDDEDQYNSYNSYVNQQKIESFESFDYLPISYYKKDDELQGLLVKDGNDDYVYYYLTPDEWNSTDAILFPLSRHAQQYTVLEKQEESPTSNSKRDEYEVQPIETDKPEDTPKELYRQFHVREYGTSDNLTLWQDVKTFQAKQINGKNICVKAKYEGNWVLNRWNDNTKLSGKDFLTRWNDACSFRPKYWKAKDINNYIDSNNELQPNLDGRQDIAQFENLTFNIAVKNFDPDAINYSNQFQMNGKCYMKKAETQVKTRRNV